MPSPYGPKFRRNPGTPWALAALAVLIAGGILFAGSPAITIDLMMHESYFVLPTGAALVYVSLAFALIGLIYFGFARIFGRKLNPVLSSIHFWLTLIAISALITRSVLISRSGSATPGSALISLRLAGTVGVIGLLGFYVSLPVFLFNLVWSSFRGRKL